MELKEEKAILNKKLIEINFTKIKKNSLVFIKIIIMNN